MTESKPGRVKKVPLRRQRYDLPSPAATVGIIADHGVPYRREMDPDLVRATGVQVRSKQVDRVEPGQPDERGLCRLTSLPRCSHDRHPAAVPRIPGDRLVDNYFVLFEMSPAHRCITTDDAAGRDRRRQQPMRTFCPRDQQEPGRFLVDPMHNAGPLLTASRRERAATEKRVDQRAAPVPRRRVDDHTSRLIDHDDVLILVNDGDRNILRQDFTARRRRDDYGDRFTPARPVAGTFETGWRARGHDGDGFVRERRLPP